MVPRPSELKLGREKGRQGPTQGGLFSMFGLSIPTPRVRGHKNVIPGSMHPKPWVGCPGLDVAVGLDWGFVAGWYFAAGWGFAAGWDFAAGVENALGEAGYPC